ncbi:MAG: mannose-1-phosphate guanylyltransferase, partial [Planctomycetales bacterium]|nr:mannose-1-phosphate guanylyltransferase [Planctomycetales bacterium]
MLHAVIMAGGAGTRFWPASRTDRPKQLLPLAGKRSMIQATVDRLAGLVPPQRVLVVTSERLAEPIRRQLPELPPSAVLGEPAKRDTAPCIGLAALQLLRDDPDATMAVMPADHVIEPTEKFQAAIQHACDLVESNPERIVTFGVKPTYAAEIFGYIQRGPAAEAAGAYRVAQFREKPDRETAERYLAAGDFYWNSGIFVWKAAHIQRELAAHEPQMFARLERIADAWGTADYDDVLRREFTAINGKSIDYAVMERATDVLVIEAPFTWDDVGNWRSLARLRGSDEHGNTIAATRHIGLDTHNTIVSSGDDHLVVTVGVKDLIVVNVGDATLVAHKDDEESIRTVVKLLSER